MTKTLLERLQREARERGILNHTALGFMFTFTDKDLNALLAHVLKEASGELEGLKYTFMEVDWGDVKSIEPVEDITKPRSYAEGFNDGIKRAQRVLTDHNS